MNAKKIGFIDYYLDEWHSNNYPKMIPSSRADVMRSRSRTRRFRHPVPADARMRSGRQI